MASVPINFDFASYFRFPKDQDFVDGVAHQCQVGASGPGARTTNYRGVQAGLCGACALRTVVAILSTSSEVVSRLEPDARDNVK